MSFISVIVCNDFITVMADSRTVELYSDGRIHRVLEEDKEKIILLSDKVFLAVSGWVQGAQEFIEKSDLQNYILENDKLKEKDEIQLWFNNSQQYMNADYHYNIRFGGATINNDLKAYVLNSKNKEINELPYGPNMFGYSLSGSQNIKGGDVLTVFKNLCEFYTETAESMLEIQAKLNDFVADNDDGVNKIKSWFCLKNIQGDYISSKGIYNYKKHNTSYN